MVPDNINKYDISIVLAVYNEEQCIKSELWKIKNSMDKSTYTYEIIVVDDCSQDKTPDILKEYPWIKLLHFTLNRGAGSARKAGTKAASGEIVVWTDVDETYPNEEIPKLVSYLKENNLDQVVGARKSEKGTIKFLRTPAKFLIRKLAEALSGAHIPDLNSGLRAFKRDIALRYLYLLPNGFSCVSTMSLSFLCNGYAVGYLPIDYRRRTGKSKFHPIKDTYLYSMQVVRMIMLFNPLKIFFFVSLVLFLLSIIISVRNYLMTGSLQESGVICFISSILVMMLGLIADLVVTVQKKE